MMEIFKPKTKRKNSRFGLYLATAGLFVVLIGFDVSVGTPTILSLISLFGLAWSLFAAYGDSPGVLQIDDEGMLFRKWKKQIRIPWRQIKNFKADYFKDPNYPKHNYSSLEIHTRDCIFKSRDMWFYTNMLDHVWDNQKRHSNKNAIDFGEKNWKVQDLKKIQSLIETQMKSNAEPVTDEEMLKEITGNG